MGATAAENRNTDFLIKSALWLGGEEELIGLRKSRAETLRLDKIQDNDRKHSAMNFSLVLNIIVIPLLAAFAGVIIIGTRKGRRK